MQRHYSVRKQSMTMDKFCLSFLVLFAILEAACGLISVQRTRKGKLLFPYIVNIAAGPCRNTAKGYYGTCFSSYECIRRSGIAEGTCAKHYGVCCVGMVTCSEQVVLNDTYFQNPNYPSSTSGSGDCAVTIRRQPNICQIRLDFDDFNLPPPNSDGICDNARFTVTVPNDPNADIPQLCGNFRMEHMYIDFKGSDYIRLNYMGTGTKSWRTRIQMIECTSLLKAPDGCRQYYHDTSGTGQVEIFGYNSKQPPHLANLKYTLCVRREMRKDKIKWEVCDPKSFSMSDDAGDPEAFQDTLCQGDYIQIFGRSIYMTLGYSDHVFCGSAMNRLQSSTTNEPITTDAKPFLIHVETDDTEVDDVNNIGFCLKYTQS